MSKISGRHLEEPSTSTHVRHLQVFSIDIDIFWSQSLMFCTFPHENAWKMSLLVGVRMCVCIYIYIYINTWFFILSTYDSGFFGLFFRDKSRHFRHFHQHLQGTLLTFDIDICRHLNPHLCTPLVHARTSSNKKTADMDSRAHFIIYFTNSQLARVNTDFLWKPYFFKNFGLSPYRETEGKSRRSQLNLI